MPWKEFLHRVREGKITLHPKTLVSFCDCAGPETRSADGCELFAFLEVGAGMERSENHDVNFQDPTQPLRRKSWERQDNLGVNAS